MTSIAHLQKHPDQSNNLFGHHERSIKSWLREELFLVPYSENLLHLFASATLVDFQQFCNIHHLIPQALDTNLLSNTGSGYPQIMSQIVDSDKWEIYVKYRKIVSRFLIDRTALWSNGQEHWQYVSLARYLLNALWYQ